MELGTTLQYTESNLIGTLYAPITSSATTIQVQFTDKVTGAANRIAMYSAFTTL